ncbi:hypothetical protein ACO0KY_19535 [Undibacterium sp. Dicai25W]|uniref:hypothetical protein n=1 Tax=Undibacterium sp. Dicai25W TaxID=3413034 RepID=UPI003BF3F646
MKKKVIFSTSGAGSVGKTMISSFYVDQARNRLGLEIETYLCDLKEKHDALYTRYGQKVDGELLPLNKQNALSGVKPLDLFMQSKGNQTDTSELETLRNELAQQFSQALESDADIILFDMPATHFSDIYTKLFASISDFANALDFSDRAIYITMPFADEKSLSSISSIYNDTKDLENINYVVAINKGKFDTSAGISVETYYNSPVYQAIKDSAGYREIILPTLKAGTVNAIDQHPFSFFYDYDKKAVIKDRVKTCKDAMMVNQDLINLLNGIKHINANGQTIEHKLLDEICNILGA